MYISCKQALTCLSQWCQVCGCLLGILFLPFIIPVCDGSMDKTNRVRCTEHTVSIQNFGRFHLRIFWPVLRFRSFPSTAGLGAHSSNLYFCTSTVQARLFVTCTRMHVHHAASLNVMYIVAQNVTEMSWKKIGVHHCVWWQHNCWPFLWGGQDKAEN